MKLRKIVSALLAGAIALTSLSVTAGAESILNAKKTVDSGKSFSLKLNSKSLEYDYKLKLSKSGDVKVTYKGAADAISLIFVDSDGANINASKTKSAEKSGSIVFNSNNTRLWWNYDTELASGTVVYSGLDKGTYYLRIETDGYLSFSGTGKTTFTVTYPQAGGSDESGAKASIAVPIKKGSTMQLDAGVSGAKWSTSDKSVVSVSDSGKITANKKGTATITAKADGSTSSVTFKVTE